MAVKLLVSFLSIVFGVSFIVSGALGEGDVKWKIILRIITLFCGAGYFVCFLFMLITFG